MTVPAGIGFVCRVFGLSQVWPCWLVWLGELGEEVQYPEPGHSAEKK